MFHLTEHLVYALQNLNVPTASGSYYVHLWIAVQILFSRTHYNARLQLHKSYFVLLLQTTASKHYKSNMDFLIADLLHR